MNKSLKRLRKIKKSLGIRRKTLKRKKKSQKGGNILNNINTDIKKNKYLKIVNKFIKENPHELKTQNNLLKIKKRVQSKGDVYDFIFVFDIKSNKYLFSKIWHHGSKQNLEDITAGMYGLHVYVQELSNNIHLLGIIKTQE